MYVLTGGLMKNPKKNNMWFTVPMPGKAMETWHAEY